MSQVWESGVRSRLVQDSSQTSEVRWSDWYSTVAREPRLERTRDDTTSRPDSDSKTRQETVGWERWEWNRGPRTTRD